MENGFFILSNPSALPLSSVTYKKYYLFLIAGFPGH